MDDTIYVIQPRGISVLDKDSIKQIISFKDQTNAFFQALQLKKNVIGIASCNGFLSYNTLTKTLDTLFSSPGVCVRSLWRYKDYLFFGTYGNGFYVMKNNIIKRMPLDKNKYLFYTHCFVPDERGFLFLSSNRGLFKTRLDELINYYDGKADNVYYYYFGKNDGMNTTELNGGCTPCALKIRNSIISFPTMDGLLWVDPSSTTPVLHNSDIYFDGLSVDNKPVSLYGNDLRFPSGASEVKLSLAIASWINKENIYLEYEVNQSGKWIPVDVEREPSITFTNLPFGNYSVKIRKLNGFGKDEYTYKTLNFSIDYPFYLKWWAVLLFSTAFVGTIIMVIRIRTRSYKVREAKLEKQVAEKTSELQYQNQLLEKNNLIKTRLISIISHDIVTPLKFVSVAGMNLLEKRNLMPDELQKETIYEMANTAQEIRMLSTNILNWIKYQNENRRMAKETFHVHELVNQVLSILQTLAKQKSLKLLNNIDEDLEVTQFFEPLKILIYNLVSNAIHFSSDNVITISNEIRNNVLILKVKDKGEGMTQEQMQNILEDRFVITSANINNKKGHGLGYLIIKDLLKMMEATIEIESAIGNGTCVFIFLPFEH